MATRGLTVAGALMLLMALFASSASAIPPDHFTDAFEDEQFYIGQCDGFDVLSSEDGSMDVKFFYTRDGEFRRAHFHFTMSGVLYNSEDPTKELPAVANQSAVTEDFLVWTQAGVYYRVTVPGAGTVLIDAGRVILDATNASPTTPPEVLWQAGNHQVWDGEIDDLCEALS